MKIGIDVDGVLADFVEGFRPLARRVTGKPCEGDQKLWDFNDWGLTEEDISTCWNHLKNTANFWMDLNPYPDAYLVTPLSKDHTLYFITTRVPTKGSSVEYQTAAWIYTYFGILYPTVIVTKHKGRVARALELDAFIDDKKENLYNIAYRSPSTKLYIRSHSYNEDGFKLSPEQCTRVASFGEFVELVTTSTELTV